MASLHWCVSWPVCPVVFHGQSVLLCFMANICSCVLGPACSDPGRPADGVQIGSSYEMGSTVTFKCNHTGFKPEPASIKCVSPNQELQWSDNTPPKCVGTYILNTSYHLDSFTLLPHI